MINMVLSTGDLLLCPDAGAGADSDCQVLADVGCLATSPQFTGSLSNGF